jgi:fatty-acyl-CoA synthase
MNSAEYLVLALALARLGAVLVPLNYRLQPHELLELIRRSGAVALASEVEFGELAMQALAEIDGLKVLLDLSTGLPQRFTSIPDLMEQHRGETVADWPCEAGDLLRIMYTSGTTSLPKGVRITHGNCWANMHAHAVEFSITHADRLLLVAPLYHVGGFDIPGLTLFHVGGTIVLLRRFDAAEVLASIERERITGTTLVATMMNAIINLGPAQPERDQFDATSMRWIIFGQVTAELFDRALELFPTTELTEGYGMTETCGGVAYVDRDHRRTKLGSVGLAVQGMEIIVADAHDQPLPHDETGEILLRGPKVCDGYLDDPEASTKALSNGWLHTGDVGRFDSDGYLYVQDRIKDMIRSGGENMSASEIERVVECAADIAEAAVIGIPHPHWVEVPAAFVVSRSTRPINCEALIAHCRAHLPGFKVPKAIFQIEVLPRNVGSKVLKAELRQLAQHLRPIWSAQSSS